MNKAADTNRSIEAPAEEPLSGALLDWYDRHRRVLPWRAAPSVWPDPYHVWLSEIMLQQTTVVTVGPYFRDFITRWPTVEALASSSLDRVLHAWQGLGYYARARNLHRCAAEVANELGGRFPQDEAELRKLPGIGPYSAAAIASIAFDRRATVVDGNVERVIARIYDVTTPLPGAKPELVDLADRLTPSSRPGDYAQAIMDLGATVCTPRNPSCGRCPWRGACRARAVGTAEQRPVKAVKKERSTRRGVAFWTVRRDGAVLLRRRPEKGLLGGMMEIPSTEWRTSPWTATGAVAEAPLTGEWQMLDGTVRHTFTHFHLELEVMTANVTTPTASGVWCPIERLGEHALPTVMKKIVRHALAKI